MLRSRTFAAAVALVLAGTAYAQVSTATIKGMITSGDTAAPAGTAVVAVNKASGFTYRTTTQANGGYALTGLPPGNYEIRITAADGVARTEAITLAVGETASVDFSMGGKSAEKVEEIVVTGTTRRKAVKTSEVGTVVSQKLIAAMPAPTRNFLSSVDLAPGVAFFEDQGSGQTKIQGGGQDRNNSNVFIDGVSQKNNILRGGASGQDSSRGNPFPQSAIAEYKVLTQNYKAEYDQVSSAAITAVTKSGGNELHGEAYFDRFETDWRSQSPIDRRNAANGAVLPFSSKNEAGLSLGGPIKEDAINYFLAYDYKNIDDSRATVLGNKDKYDLTKGILPDLSGKTGSFVDPFVEHLLFGKVNASLAENRKVWASFRMRLESDNVAEDRTWSANGNNKDRTNNDFRFDVVHEWNVGSDLVSETKLSYQNALWNPHGAATGPYLKYFYSTTNSINAASPVIFDGGVPDNQKRGQSGFTLAQDVTFTGLRGNVIKGGLKASVLNYALSGTSRAVDIVQTILDPATGLPFYDGANCTGTGVTNNGANSNECKIDRALAPASVSLDNVQFGLYAQDDWAVTSRLELNIGARWDYETNMLNNSYVTPAERVAAIYAADVPRWGITPPAGQTYAESLAKGGVNIGDYISDGKSRKSFAGAIAPRLGASYDLFGDRNTVFFAGWGRSYDRAMANHALDEKQKNAQAGGEIWLIRNDLKMPYADQASVGVRQAIAFVNAEVAYSMINGKNQFQWFSGNRDANGGWATQPSFDPLWGGPDKFGSLILGDTVGETKTKSVLFKAEKPYSAASKWSASIAYTYTDAQTKHRDWNDDIFDWTIGKPTHGWNPSTLIDKHRIVAAAMADLPYDFQIAGRYTFGSGLTRRIVGCPTGGCIELSSDQPNFAQVDVGVQKTFKAGPGGFVLRADVLNVINKANYAFGTNDWGGGQPGAGAAANRFGLDNLDIDKPFNLRGPMRTVKLTGTYSF
ncbi:MAG: TonB-dependent receptor [Anaeromyxobacter sp.]